MLADRHATKHTTSTQQLGRELDVTRVFPDDVNSESIQI